jgi:DNA-binding response OmpR family regulator
MCGTRELRGSLEQQETTFGARPGRDGAWRSRSRRGADVRVDTNARTSPFRTASTRGFRRKLPRNKEGAAVAYVMLKVPNEGSADRMRLLIVEDDPDGREMLAELFRMHAWEVTAVPSTEAGMAELRQGGFDVVISDENLEGQSGSSMLRHANDEGLLGDVGVLMYTAEPGRLKVPHGVRVLRKPLGIMKLLDEARAVAPDSDGKPAPDSDKPSSRRLRRNKAGVELVLYVTDSPSSRRALANLRHVLDHAEVSRVNVEIHNLDHDPFDPAAAEDHVTFTPVLVKRQPGDPERYLDALDSTHTLAALIEELDASAPASSQRSHHDAPPPSSMAK